MGSLIDRSLADRSHRSHKGPRYLLDEPLSQAPAAGAKADLHEDGVGLARQALEEALLPRGQEEPEGRLSRQASVADPQWAAPEQGQQERRQLDDLLDEQGLAEPDRELDARQEARVTGPSDLEPRLADVRTEPADGDTRRIHEQGHQVRPQGPRRPDQALRVDGQALGPPLQPVAFAYEQVGRLPPPLVLPRLLELRGRIARGVRNVERIVASLARRTSSGC
jgi:hypothetical protein